MKTQVDAYLSNIKKGDMESLGLLYDCTKRQLFGLCYTYFKNREKSEDALSEAYLNIVKEIDKFKGKNGFNWMYTITKNICLNKLKEDSRYTIDEYNDELQNEYTDIEDKSDVACVIIQIASKVLDDKECKILLLHAMFGYKFKDIASIIGGLESTTRWQYNNALKKVRREYDNYEK